MRDLYRRLGLSPDARPDEIRAAIERCNHAELKRDAEQVLVDDARRGEYDRYHAALSDIGRLRARLGLTHAPHWHLGPADDFSLPPDTRGAAHDALMARLTRAARLHNRWQRLGGGRGLAALVLAALLAGAGLMHWLR